MLKITDKWEAVPPKCRTIGRPCHPNDCKCEVLGAGGDHIIGGVPGSHIHIHIYIYDPGRPSPPMVPPVAWDGGMVLLVPPPVACGGGMVLLVPPPVACGGGMLVCWYVGMLVSMYVCM